MTMGIIIAPSPAGEVKSHHNPSFRLPPYYSSTSPMLKNKSPHCILSRSPSLSGQIENVALISMTGTGGFGMTAAQTNRVLLSHYHFHGYGCLHACRRYLHSPSRGRKTRRKENHKLTLMLFSSRNATLCLDICPAPGSADSTHRQAPVNKSASGLNGGEALMKLRPGANAREMPGNLTNTYLGITHAWKS